MHICDRVRSQILQISPKPLQGSMGGALPRLTKSNMFVQSVCFQKHLPRKKPSSRASSLHGRQMTPRDPLVYNVIKQRKSKWTLACSLQREADPYGPHQGFTASGFWLALANGSPTGDQREGRVSHQEGLRGRSLPHVSGFPPRLYLCGLCPPLFLQA